MSSNFIDTPSYVAKLEAFTYGLTGYHVPVSDITLTALGMALLLLCLKAPIFDVGHR